MIIVAAFALNIAHPGPVFGHSVAHSRKGSDIEADHEAVDANVEVMGKAN